MLSNLHTHCCFCDGVGRPEEYVAKALEKGFAALGFSSHSPVPFANSWSMSEKTAEDYLKTIDCLKDRYKNSIQIYKGMEIDYLSGDAKGFFQRYDLDYTIGSVHYISIPGKKKYYSIDGKLEHFVKTLHECSGSSIEKLVSRYYETVLEMLANNSIDILGHLDLVKKNNSGNRFFSEKEQWYISLVKNVVKKIACYDVVVEINTGGIARGYMDDVYPSEWIIRECKKCEIPVALCSDAHAPENIDSYFEEAKGIMRSAGYNEIWGLNNGRWVKNRF